MCCGDDDGRECRQLRFLLGLPFAVLAVLVSIVRAIIWIIELPISCICPCDRQRHLRDGGWRCNLCDGGWHLFLRDGGFFAMDR